jgi:hypothetical protein
VGEAPSTDEGKSERRRSSERHWKLCQRATGSLQW